MTAGSNPVSNAPAKPQPPPASSQAQTALLDPPPEQTALPPQGRLHLWLHRVSVFLFVLIAAVAGVLLIILPWTPGWTDNYLLLSYPSLRMLVANGFFRGLCSGLGLLDVWIGFWEALHYRELS